MENKETNQIGDELLKASEVKQYLKIGTNALWAYTTSGLLPSYRIGSKTIRFKKADVLALLVPNVAKELDELHEQFNVPKNK
jgi:hypothetical protein